MLKAKLMLLRVDRYGFLGVTDIIHITVGTLTQLLFNNAGKQEQNILMSPG